MDKLAADVVQGRVLAVAHRQVVQGDQSGSTSALAHSTASHNSTSAGITASTRCQAGQAKKPEERLAG